MDKLTLDTNILEDWAWCEGRSTSSRYSNDEAIREELKRLFRSLVALRDNGVCELGITTQIDVDYHKTQGELPQHIEEMIGPYVVIDGPYFFGGSGFAFPVVFPNFKEVFEPMFEDVFPNAQPDHRLYLNKRRDIWQLYAHRVANRDFFITSDRGILDKHIVLAERWNIRVSALDKYVSERATLLADRWE